MSPGCSASRASTVADRSAPRRRGAGTACVRRSTSRRLAPRRRLPRLCELALPLLRVGGSLCALVTRRPGGAGVVCRGRFGVRRRARRRAGARRAPGRQDRTDLGRVPARDGRPEPAPDQLSRRSDRRGRRRRARSTEPRRPRSRGSSRGPCRRTARCRPGRRGRPRSRSPPSRSGITSTLSPRTPPAATAPAAICSRIELRSSWRGSSSVMTLTSARRAATAPIAGRFSTSRSPAEPKTAQSLPAVVSAQLEEHRLERVGRMRVVDDHLERLAEIDALHPPGDRARGLDPAHALGELGSGRARRGQRCERIADVEAPGEAQRDGHGRPTAWRR